jgi:hypothetical protein
MVLLLQKTNRDKWTTILLTVTGQYLQNGRLFLPLLLL